jgi:hypothetical protein
MSVDRPDTHNTIFGEDMEVTVYPEHFQHKFHISILVHPDMVSKVKKIINGTTHSSKENDALNKT